MKQLCKFRKRRRKRSRRSVAIMLYSNSRKSPLLSMAAADITLTLTLTLTLVCSVGGFNVRRQDSDVKRSTPTAGLYKYVIVLDAGSSGTKASVFQFDVTDDLNQQQQQQGNDCTAVPLKVTELSAGKIKVKPGLHTFAHDSSPDALNNYFATIFSSLASVQGVRTKETVLYMLATAGKRQLQRQDAGKAEKLKADVQDILSNRTLNPYVYSQNNFRVISGKEEGVYAWVAANFLNGVLHTADMKNSVGIVEMGGSSLQMAYLMSQPSPTEQKEKDVCDIRVNGQVRRLHVDSYPGFGANGIVKKVLEKACEGVTNGTAGAVSPCLLTGDSTEATCANINDTQVAVTGTSNPKQCAKTLEMIVNSTVPDHDVIRSMVFYGLGALRYSLQTLRVVDGVTGDLNQDSLEQQAEIYCNKTFKEAASTFQVSEKYVSATCIQGLFIDDVLERLDLADNVLRMSQTLNGATISWALGAAVDFSMNGLSLHCNGEKPPEQLEI